MKVAILLLALLLSLAFGQEDVSKDEERLKSVVFSKYNKNVLPPYNNTQPVYVNVGFSLIFIEKLDPNKQTLSLHGWMKYSWNDSRLKWQESDYGGINALRVEMASVWVPDVTLYNSVSLGDLEYASSFKTKHVVVYSNGTTIWIPAISLKSVCEVDLTYYPFDTHNCTLKFGSWVFDGHRLNIKPYKNENYMDLSETYNNTEWSIISTTVAHHLKYYSCCAEPYPDVTYSMVLKRSSLYHASILFPVSAGIILALAAFLISPYNNLRIYINTFNLFLFVYTIFHMFSMFPSTGSHTPCVVLISQCLTILMALGIVWNVLIRMLTTRLSATQPSAGIKRLLNTWPIKDVFVSTSHTAFTMEECAKEVKNKEQDAEAIVKDEKLTMNNWISWVKFFIFLDRLAFVSFIIILVAILAAFTR